MCDKECVAVLIELYKKNVTVSCVGSDLVSEWALSTVHSQPVVVVTSVLRRKGK